MSKKILLVDDSRTALTLQRMMLNNAGCEVYTACNGRQGVALAAEVIPDLIVMDVIMPELDGFAAVRELRSMDQLEHTPIIMMTTRSEGFNVREGYAAGCSDYLTKPFSGYELLAKVSQYLDEDPSMVEVRL